MTKTIPAEINSNSKAIFIAQAPGSYENEKGIPLIGDKSDRRTAGVILQEILTELEYVRTDFCYTNVYNKYLGKKKSGSDIVPNKKQIRNEFPRISDDILQSKCEIIFTLGEEADSSLKEMKELNEYSYLKHKKIIKLPYPRGNTDELRAKLNEELKKPPTK